MWQHNIDDYLCYSVWEQACDAFAKQLVEQGEVLQASSYLLATHKVHEAVRLLKDSGMYQDAVAIAKCRLSADDPLICEVVFFLSGPLND